MHITAQTKLICIILIFIATTTDAAGVEPATAHFIVGACHLNVLEPRLRAYIRSKVKLQYKSKLDFVDMILKEMKCRHTITAS